MSIAAAMSVSTTPTTRLRLTARGRRVVAFLVALPIVVALSVAAVLGGGAAIASGSAGTVEFDYVTVQAGQSLWSIAEDIAPASDPRDVIAEIRSLNQLSTSSVQPGQRIAIPVDLAQ
jgi:LysM repeat protein